MKVMALALELGIEPSAAIAILMRSPIMYMDNRNLSIYHAHIPGHHVEAVRALLLKEIAQEVIDHVQGKDEAPENAWDDETPP